MCYHLHLKKPVNTREREDGEGRRRREEGEKKDEERRRREEG
jgi:hypothetical protein